MQREITVFEVLDNYFGTEDYPSPDRFNYGEIRDIRKHILDFYKVFKFVPRKNFETRVFLGSFLSSPPWNLGSAPYLSSALLCADSVVLFDPLYYLFSDEQYQRPRIMGAPEGWRDWQTGKPNYERTKRHLGFALEWYKSTRPLIDAGIVVLIPSENIISVQQSQIQELKNGVEERLTPVSELTRKFNPEDITIEDNRKGLFVFAGGNKDFQIRDSLSKGFLQFSKDIAISNNVDALYTAPFKWEKYLSENTLSGFNESSEFSKLFGAIKNLDIPILSNLTTDTLINIHKDSGYTHFRSSLKDAFKNINAEIDSADFKDRVLQIEKDILRPKIESIHNEIKSSRFENITKAVQEGVFSFTQTFIGNVPTGLDFEKNILASSFVGSVSLLRQMIMKISKSPDRRIWMDLIPEKPSEKIYGTNLKLSTGSSNNWEIDDEPSMKIKVSAGIIKDFHY